MFDFENILLWILAFDKTILIPNIAIFKYFGFWSFTVLHLISLIREYISQNEPCISIAIYVVYFIHKHWNIILFWLYLQLWLRYLRSLFIAHTQNLLKMYNREKWSLSVFYVKYICTVTTGCATTSWKIITTSPEGWVRVSGRCPILVRYAGVYSIVHRKKYWRLYYKYWNL